MTRTLEEIVLTRKRVCCRCGKTMQRGDCCIKYTVDQKGTIFYHQTKYWCERCEKEAAFAGGEGEA